MASSSFDLTDQSVALLEKAIKTKPKDTKARVSLHKKANDKLTVTQKSVAEDIDAFTDVIDKSTRTLQEALGVATSEAKLLDREVVRHLKRAIKLSKSITRPNKGWMKDYDKAVKAVADWDPKAQSVDALEDGIKLLQAGKKALQANYDAYRPQQKECNEIVREAVDDLDSLRDDSLKEVLTPYFIRYGELMEAFG